jgi:hypothetical protein
MTRLLLLGILSLGLTCVAVAKDGDGQGESKKDQAPEIDPSQAVSAFALLGGSTLVIRGRRKK